MLLELLGAEHREPAECVLRVEGQQIAQLYPFLTEVSVECGRGQAAQATLSFESRRDEQGRWSVQDAGVFAPWRRVVIEAAFGAHTEEVMRGHVREVTADYPRDSGGTTVKVICQDESLALDREYVRRMWGAEAPTTDQVILSEVLARHGLAPHPDCAPGRAGVQVSQDGTDICFLRTRAEANGYELIFSDGLVYFGPMRLDSAPQPPIMVYAGQDTNCLSFSARADGHQPDSVAYDVAPQQGGQTLSRTVQPDLPSLGTEGADSAGSGLADFSWRLRRQGGMDDEGLQAMAQGKANQLAMKVKAQGELDGSLYGHVLRVAQPVGVDGVGQMMGGIYYVDAVTHRFTIEGYRQSFELLRNAFGDNLEGGGHVLAGVL